MISTPASPVSWWWMINCYRWRLQPACWLSALSLTLLAAPAFAAGDADFASRHPRLFYSASDLPALRARVHDGGVDDAAYAYIRTRSTGYYVSAPLDSIMADDYAHEPIINLALASHFESSVDSSLVNLGRRLTLHIARNWNRDTDVFGTSLRLRDMAVGFDHFFVRATPAERQEIRDEVQSYISYITTNMNYDIWRHSPYTSNKTAMLATALGLAGICFKDELPSSITDAALVNAEDFYRAWRDTHLADDGCYREGVLYVTWSLRCLIYYFDARKRFDGIDHGLEAPIRAVERWVPYEIDPRGEARSNNIQDQTDYFRPLAHHTTYWAWAQAEWGSHLAAYMWDHSAGQYGKDVLDENDKAGTVLWHRNLAPVNPGTVLSKSHVWEDRGLYYFRTGWGDGATSNDVVFSLYSGEFRGGHAQEDQNQFTLSAYGEKLVLDNGMGSMAKQSEAHNIVRVDGNGEHNAGSSIGTDGKITGFITTDYADYVRGDATSAYSTHSPYNDPGVPYPWSNWNWGLTGANPVEHALRTVVSVHGDGVLPYFVIRDDIQKDDVAHHYDWCMHTPSSAVIDTTTGTLAVTSGAASLRVFCVQPARSALHPTIAPFDNYNEDPNSKLLMLRATAVDPHFTFVLMPLPAGFQTNVPAVTRTPMPNGARVTIDWANGMVDDVVMRDPYTPGGAAADASVAAAWNMDTDASLGFVRRDGALLRGFTLVDVTRLTMNGVLIAAVDDAPASLVFDGTDVHLDRVDAEFRLDAGMFTRVLFRGNVISTHVEGNYRVRTVPTGVRGTPAGTLRLQAYPNPFNPDVQISFVNPSRERVVATVHDVAGRRVATLAARVMDAGSISLGWDGRNESGDASASGVYFVKVRAGTSRATTKLVLVR